MKEKGYSFPEGAISLERIDKIYLSRLLEEGGAEDLAQVLSSFTYGKVLEEQGKFKEATNFYKEALKHNPKNPWIKAAASRIRHLLN